MTESKLLNAITDAANEKNAEDIVILNVKGLSSLADYFIVCHGNSVNQVQAIAREIKDSAEALGEEIEQMEGIHEGRWVLIDIGDIIVHVFHREERDFYHLERLWGDAPVEMIPSEQVE